MKTTGLTSLVEITVFLTMLNVCGEDVYSHGIIGVKGLSKILDEQISVFEAYSVTTLFLVSENSVTRRIIASDLPEIREKLEKCFEMHPQDSPSYEKERYYAELADMELKPLAEIKANVEIFESKIHEFLEILDTIDARKIFGADAEKTIEAISFFDAIIQEYWLYFLPSTRKAVRDALNQPPQAGIEKGLISSVYFNVRLLGGLCLILVQSLKSKKNLIKAYMGAVSSLGHSILESVLGDIETEEDWEDSCVAEEEARREGTISWDSLRAELDL